MALTTPGERKYPNFHLPTAGNDGFLTLPDPSKSGEDLENTVGRQVLRTWVHT